MKKKRIFSKIFQTSPEYILGILEPLQASKTEIFSKFGFSDVFHTPN